MSKHVLVYKLSQRVLTRQNGAVYCHRCGGVLVLGDCVVSREVRAKHVVNRSVFYHEECWEAMFV
jgi:hypothetical protein